MLRARLMKYFIAIKSEVTGVNRAAAVSCQNESGSCWLKLIGPSQTMIWIETLDTCNKDIQLELRCMFLRYDYCCWSAPSSMCAML